MLKALFDKLERSLAPDSGAGGEWSDSIEHDLELAAAALLVEMTRADDTVEEVEEQAVIAAVRDAFGLDAAEAAALHERARDRAGEAVSLFEFTRLINDRLDDTGKERVVECMWRVAVADGDIDHYEEHLVRKVADLLHLPHSRFMLTKHRALADSGRRDRQRTR